MNMNSIQELLGNPDWESEINQSYLEGAAHAFILCGNVQDYVLPGVRLKSYLAQRNSYREIVAFYNPSSGISFAIPTMETKFREVLGISGSDPALDSLGLDLDTGPQPLPSSPAEALPLLERMLTLTANDFLEEGQEPEVEPKPACTLIIDYPEGIVPDGDIVALSPADRISYITLSRWGIEPTIEETGNTIYLLTQALTQINSSLRAASNKWELIEVSLPDAERRQNFIELYLEESPIEFEGDFTPAKMANLTAGLSLVHIEDILLRGGRVGSLDVKTVSSRKGKIIESEFAGLVEVVEPRFGFEMIGGLEHVKKFFYRSVIKPVLENNLGRVPMGALLPGPPGTGKTAIAEAVAYEAGFNMINLRVGLLKNQYVGNSQKNLERVIGMAKVLTPVFIFIDEIDQSVSRGQGDGSNQVDSNMFQRLLEIMSDTGNRGKIIWLSATNRPDNIDPALMRPGRCDKIIPFLAPNKDERIAILKVMLKKYSLLDKAEFDQSHLQNFQQITDNWTGADIEGATVKALEIYQDENLSVADAVLEAVQRIRPTSSGVEFMTKLALEVANDVDLVPEEYKADFLDRATLVNDIQELREKQPGFRKSRR